MATDFAQTPHAQANRLAKAERLAVRAAELGLQPYELRMPQAFGTLADEGRRERVRRDLDMRSRPSDQTWAMALDLLEVGSRSRNGATQCGLCGWAVVVIKTPKGDPRPLDPFPHPAGTVHVRTDDGRLVAVVITGTDTPPANTPLFRQHASSCPETRQAAARRRREAPRCTSCDEPLDGYLALMEREHTTHPNCTGGR